MVVHDNVVVCITLAVVAERLDLDRLNEEDPFEIDDQPAHLLSIPVMESRTSSAYGLAIPLLRRQAPGALANVR
jgi:hypothetical protein